MNELLNTTVLSKGDGIFGTFTVQNGTVKKGSNIILTFFNQMVLVPTNARQSFTIPQEHQLFDGLLFALMGANVGVEYIADVRSFLNPELRMAEFLKLDAVAAAKFNTRFGLNLTAEELRLATIQVSVTEKFGKVFATPKTPVPPIAIDVDKVFGDNAETVAKWLNNEVTDTNNVIRTIANTNAYGSNNLLRIRKNGTRTNGVQCLTGHFVSVTTFKDAAKRSVRLWNGAKADARKDMYIDQFYIHARQRGDSYNSNQRVSVYPDFAQVGCQKVSRSEIERILAELEAA